MESRRKWSKEVEKVGPSMGWFRAGGSLSRCSEALSRGVRHDAAGTRGQEDRDLIAEWSARDKHGHVARKPLHLPLRVSCRSEIKHPGGIVDTCPAG